MLQKIRGIIESKRRVSDVSFDTQITIISSEETIDLRSISAARRRSVSESFMQPMHLEPSHHRQYTCPVMVDIVLDADTFPQEKIPKRCSVESLKTLDTESLTCSEADSYSRRRSDCSLENNTDSNPSYDDVYSSLSSDAPINVDVFVQALQGMYAKGQIDSSLHEQFANKVDNLKLCQEIAMSSSFCIAILYTVAGVLFTIGAIDIGLTSGAVQNIFLTGSCIYFCGGSFGLFKQWKAARSSWDTLQSVVSALQQYTLQETTTQRR